MGGGGGGLLGGISDVLTGLVGGETRAEKKAKESQAQQAQALAQAQADAQKQLQEKQDRIKRAQKGRASLLSGTEQGIIADNQIPLQKTLG